MVRAPCCEKMGLKKGPWTPEEDQILIAHIQRHGHGNWRALPKQAGLLRCGKSCRLRWVNYLRPDIKRGSFTRSEEDAIISLHKLLGNRWSAIAAKLPGRTDNEIKNVWHTHLKKRLTTTTTTTPNAAAAAAAAAATTADASVQASKQSPKIAELGVHPTEHSTNSSAATCADHEYNYYSPSVTCSGDINAAVDDLPNEGSLFSNDREESFFDDRFWLEAAVWLDDWDPALDFRKLQVPCADPSYLEGSVVDVDIWAKLAMEESGAQDLP